MINLQPIRFAIEQSSAKLLELLRGITEEQKRTNELLERLLTFEAVKATTAQRRAVGEAVELRNKPWGPEQ